jgi:hypothetical protein
MKESWDPYAPPRSDITQAPGKQGPGLKEVFSPTQGAVGAFFGGPLAGTYFIRANFLALGDAKRAGLATLCGLIICVAILLALPFLPERMPGFIVPMAYTITARVIIERTQFTKAQIADSSTLTFHSNWRVAGVTALGFLIFGVVGVAAFLLLTPI